MRVWCFQKSVRSSADLECSLEEGVVARDRARKAGKAQVMKGLV